ncbi:MAG TPA: ABC transporter substrate-binding protein [Pyrinomonadaceae bacterium]|nr:ABC transporter substrate-binding protein [Pyrinomonadaceae bacterium]
MLRKAIIVAIGCALLIACQPGGPGVKKPLKIGLVTWLGYGPFYIAQEKGFLKENNVEVQLEKIEGDVERRAAIASGNLDAIALTLDSMIVLRSNGIPLKAVMAIDTSNGGDGIVAVQSIGKIQDLKGHEIAFPTGLPSHFFLYSVLKENGMKMSDIKPVVMDADQAGAAFASGKIDAAVTWEPWLSKAKEVGRGQVLADSRTHPGLIADVLFMREDAIASRSQEIEGLIKAWYKAVDFVSTNPDEAKAIMSKAFGLSSDKVTALLPGIRYEGKQGNQMAFGSPDKPGFLFPLYDRISDAWLSESVIKQRDTPQEGLAPDFVRRIP